MSWRRRWRYAIWAHLLLPCWGGTYGARIAVTAAANGTTYYVSSDAPSVLGVLGAPSVPLYAHVRGVALTPDGGSLFVSLSTNAVMRLDGLSPAPQLVRTSTVAAGRAGVWALPRFSQLSQKLPKRAPLAHLMRPT
jgi:hypothetical protein